MSEYNKIVFFNGHQNGDISNSRGVVNYIVEKLGNSFQYIYLHNRNPYGIFFDDKVEIYNPGNHYGKQFPYQHLGDIKASHHFRLHYTLDDMVFLNVWIGCSPYYVQNRIPKGNGITKKSIYNQTIEPIDYLNELLNVSIPYPNSEEDVMPHSVKNPRNKQIIDNFVSDVLSKYRKSVLIPNGQVESGQTPQFNFGNEISNIIELNQDVAFIFTEKNFEPNFDNCHFVNEICDIPNLNEIDYLSRNCNVLITRASGPGCLVSTLENYKDTTKTFISFTSNPAIAFEALCTDEEIESRTWGDENTAKMIWSDNFTPENISMIIGNSIK